MRNLRPSIRSPLIKSNFNDWPIKIPSEGTFPMGTPAKYREHAADCLKLALRMSAPEDKARLLSAAERWRSLADRAERRRASEAGALAPAWRFWIWPNRAA